MAKKGMKRYYTNADKNLVRPVPELQGKIKSGKEKAEKTEEKHRDFSHNRSYEDSYPFGLSQSDCAVENIVNDLGLTAADMEDLEG